jgi:hypothetical protein
MGRLRGQASAEVGELTDPLPGCPVDGAGGEGPVLPGRAAQLGGDLHEAAGQLPVGAKLS